MNKSLVIDVDGHILEPSDLWTRNIEPEYRDMAMHMGVGEDGLEQWFSEGKGDRFLSKGTSANMATVSKTREWRQKNIFENPSVTWEQGREMNPGACNPDARVELMDMEGIDKSILYPSLGLSWAGGTKDPALAAAYCRVYNDWLVDFCSAHPDRLYPAITLPWTDVNEAVKELKRTAGVGPRAVMCPATPPHDRSYGTRYWDPLWEEFQEQDLPPALHVSAGGTPAGSLLHPEIDKPSWWIFSTSQDIQLSFMSFFQGGVFDRFPTFRLVVLESGTLWMPYILDRMDEKFEVVGFSMESKEEPSTYFKTRGWISMEPEDEYGALTAELLGADRVLWAYDYPHSDSWTGPVKTLRETLSKLPEDDQRKVMGENALDLYKLN